MLYDATMSEVAAFLDTNYCLHYPLPDQIDWQKFLSADKVRIIICLGLIDELDEKKSHPTFGSRAKKWLKLIATCGESEIAIRPGVTIEQFIEDSAIESKNSSKGDVNILNQAKVFQDDNPSINVVLVTEDYGMVSRCRSKRIKPITPGETARLPDEKSEEKKEILRLNKELAESLNKQPRVKLLVAGDDGAFDDRGPIRIQFSRSINGKLECRLKEYLQKYPPPANNPKTESEIARLWEWHDNQVAVDDDPLAQHLCIFAWIMQAGLLQNECR